MGPRIHRKSRLSCQYNTMTTLQPIRMSPIGVRDPTADTGIIVTPTTPRPTYRHIPPPQPSRLPDKAGTVTPTRDSFATANGKRSLPDSLVGPEGQQEPTQEDNNPLGRQDSLVSSHSQSLQDVDMIVSDEEEGASDNDSNDENSERPSKKKKKSQKFFCTDFPPCNLSFTRSEHLARHIRYLPFVSPSCCSSNC